MTMKQYLKLIDDVLAHGSKRKDRTGTGTISIFGYQMRFNLQEGFPLLTTKKMHLKSIIHELLWFISGDTNIRYLVQNGVRIWNEWPYERFRKSEDFHGETMQDFIEKIKEDENFAQKYGDLGPVYGHQWRHFEGPDNRFVDQLSAVIQEIKKNPQSRRLIVSAWNPPMIPDMALPPCHMMFQFYVQDEKLSCQLYQRSADIFLGVPFNIASYALLTMMVAQVTGLQVGEFIHTLGDAHIYLNHLEQVQLQRTRTPKKLPKIFINPKIDAIEKFTFDDFSLQGYKPHPPIKGKVSV